jgi:hypothetical protein
MDPAAILKWREDADKRTKCNERWDKHKHLFEEFIEVIKPDVSDDLIMCMEHVETLPTDCGQILMIDRYEKYLPARMLLAEILEVFATKGDYMTLVKLFIIKMVHENW